MENSKKYSHEEIYQSSQNVKNMLRKTDFEIQTILLLAYIFTLLASIAEKDILILTLMIMFCLGILQVISVIGNGLHYWKGDKQIKNVFLTYILGVMIYFPFMITYFSFYKNEFKEIVFWISLLLPLILAIINYYLNYYTFVKKPQN